MTNLVVQSYGARHEYRRAVFSIWSFFVHHESAIEKKRVILFTDDPDFFKPYFGTLPVAYVLITPEKLRHMRGRIDFVHRVKIAAIEEAFAMANDNLLYVDSDTFFIADPAPFMNRLAPQRAFMHIAEYPFSDMKTLELPAGATFHRFYDFIIDKTFYLTDGTPIRISPQQTSWNAGVIVLHHEHRKCIPDVFKLTDDFYPDTENHGCEQYAFSIILERHATVGPCDDMIYHYWLPVKKPIADKFLLPRITDRWAAQTDAQKTADIRLWTQELPVVFETDVLMFRARAIQWFNENRFVKAWGAVLRALRLDPFNWIFLRHTLYHTRRLILLKLLRKA